MPAIFNRAADLASPVCLEIVVGGPMVDPDDTTAEILNIYHVFGDLGNPGMVDLLTIGNAVTGLLGTAVSPLLANNYVPSVATIRVLDDPTALPVDLTPPANGGNSGDSLPTVVAVSMDLHTSARGRCFRGRKHLAPIPETLTTANRLNTTGTDLANTMVSDLNPAALTFTDGSNTYRMGVLSRINSVLVGPSISFTYSLVVEATYNPILGTMRRRKEGVGI